MKFFYPRLKDFHIVKFGLKLTLLFLFSISFLLISHSSAAEIKETDCGLDGCKIKFVSRYEAYIACEAVHRTHKFFKKYGYEINPQITIEFIKNTKKIKTEEHPCGLDFPAWYDSGKKCILITSRETDYCWSRKFFGIFILDIEFITSIVTHEVAHRFFDNILKSKRETTSHGFHEFVAYITQIETIAEAHKSIILSLWPEERLPSVFAVTSFFCKAHPNKFGVLSYRFFKSQPETFKQILDGKIKPIEKQFILDYP
jgi:hypothetical protein